MREELAAQREKVKRIREELAREKLKLSEARSVGSKETLGEVEAVKPPGA